MTLEDGAVELLYVLLPHLTGVQSERIVASGKLVPAGGGDAGARGGPPGMRASIRSGPQQRALDHVDAMSQCLPEEPRAKVAEIIGEILELILQAGLFPPGSRDLFVLQRTAREYLPTSVDAYLALPASCATTAVLRDGRTALQSLVDQLDLLNVEVGEIGDAARHRDSERLLVHGRFLEQVFGRGSNELELPPPE